MVFVNHILFFKYNRSPVYVVTELCPKNTHDWIHIKFLDCYVLLADNWLRKEDVKFILEV